MQVPDSRRIGPAVLGQAAVLEHPPIYRVFIVWPAVELGDATARAIGPTAVAAPGTPAARRFPPLIRVARIPAAGRAGAVRLATPHIPSVVIPPRVSGLTLAVQRPRHPGASGQQ